MLVGAHSIKSIAREKEEIRRQVYRSRSNSRGRSILAKRVGRGAEMEADKTTLFRPRADSAGFVDTPISMGPATTLLSSQRLSELGAVGGSMEN